MRGFASRIQNYLSIKKMIMLGLSIMTLLVCIVGTLGTLGQYSVRRNAEKMLSQDMPALEHLNNTLSLGLSMKDHAKEVTLEDTGLTTPAGENSVAITRLNTLKNERIEEVNSTYTELLSSLTNFVNATTQYTQTEQLATKVKNAATALFITSKNAIQTPSETTLTQLAIDEKSFSQTLGELSSFSSTLLADKAQKNIGTANTVAIAILASTLLSALLCWLITTLLWQNIFSKVTRLQEAARLIEDGAVLSAKDEPLASVLTSNNEFAVLAKSLIKSSKNVKETTEDSKNTILFDTATSLPNKLALNKRLGAAVLKPKHNFALMLLSCDRIDKVKDSYGTLVRDRLCQEIAVRISKNVKNKDYVVHLNQDEYAVLLEPIHSQEEVLDVAKRLMNSIALPFDIDDHIIDVSGHLGIVFADHSYTTIDAVMADAEMAMQKAKEAGPGRWKVFKTSIKNDHELRMQLVQDLRHAIDNDGLELYYQSIIDLNKRTIDGFEALVRWKHPERGEIFPDTFIPIAEENDLIYDLDLYVLKKASEQIKTWNIQFGNDHKVNINMSSQSLVHSQLLKDFDTLVEAYNLNPSFLSLDINENFLVENTKHSRSVLQKLRSMGVSIILDDFGTGYSAISNLQNSQVDEVKIDRSFIQDIHNKEDRLNVVRTIVTLAQNMNLQVTAEGVESKAQLYLLEELGCNHAQGYLFTKPKNIHDIEKMLEKQRVRRAKVASDSSQKTSETRSQSKPHQVPPMSDVNQRKANKLSTVKEANRSKKPVSNKDVTQQKRKRPSTDTVIEEVEIKHPVNHTMIPEMATGAPKNLLLANSNLRDTVYDEQPL